MKATPILNAALVLCLLAGVTACTKRDETMGPAQKAGKAVDNVGDQVARDLHANIDKANQATKEIEKSARDTADRINQDTSEKINQATEDASKGLDKATVAVGKKVERAGEKIQESTRAK